MVTRIHALCWVGILLLSASAATAGSNRVVLLPIVVHSAEQDTSYLSTGLGDMLAARLERSPGIEILRLDTGKAATTDRRAAQALAREAGGAFVVYGSFTQFGTGASLDMRCAPVDEAEGLETDPRQVFIQSGSVGEIIPKLDDLADKLARYVATSGSAGAVGAATAPAATPAAGGASGTPATGSSELDDLRRRVEALERAIDPAKALQELGDVPEPEPPGDGAIGYSNDARASAPPGTIPLR